jgi:hypothetical protein
LIGARDVGDAMRHAHVDMTRRAFGHQQCDDRPRRTVAEQLPERLLVIGDAVALHQSDEIMLRVAIERGFVEMRIGRDEAIRRAMQIGEVAASATRDQDFRADFVGVVEQQHLAAALSRGERAHQPRGARADHDHVKGLHVEGFAHAPLASISFCFSVRVSRLIRASAIRAAERVG